MTVVRRGRLRRTVGAGVWLCVMGGLVWYGTRLSPLSALVLGGSLAAGLLTGFTITRRWFAVTLMPLILFAVGGLVLSTQVSNTHASGGGDWSDAAQVAFGGIWFGLIATAVGLITWLGRDGVTAIARRLTGRS
ncbi:MAG TPA: hypothetical protein VGL44_15965 [Gaiellales bacterium]